MCSISFQLKERFGIYPDRIIQRGQCCATTQNRHPACSEEQSFVFQVQPSFTPFDAETGAQGDVVVASYFIGNLLPAWKAGAPDLARLKLVQHTASSTEEWEWFVVGQWLAARCNQLQLELLLSARYVAVWAAELPYSSMS